jgi:hypothetical protein
LHHDLEKLSSNLGADERASISSAAKAWFEQHPSAHKFIVKDPNVTKYFPLISNTPQEGTYSAFRAAQQSP